MAKKKKKVSKISNFQKYVTKRGLTTTTVYLSKGLHAKLKQRRKKTSEPMNAIIVRGLEKELKKAA